MFPQAEILPNLLDRHGTFSELGISLGPDRAPLRVLAAGDDGVVKGGRLYLSLRPEGLSLHIEQPDLSASSNLFEAEVIDTVNPGNFVECRVGVGHHKVGIQIDHFEQLVPGQKVFLSFEPESGLCLIE